MIDTFTVLAHVRVKIIYQIFSYSGSWDLPGIFCEINTGLATATTAAATTSTSATANSGKSPEEPGCSVASFSRPAGL